MTRPKNSRDLTHWIVMLAVGAAVYLIGCHFARAGVGPAAVTSASPPIDWSFWIAIASALGTAASIVVHRIAAKTHSAKLEAVAQDLDEVRGLAGLAKPALAIVPQPSDPAATKAGTGAAGMLAVLVLGALAAPVLTGCHTAAVQQVESEGKAAGSAVLTCAKRLAPGQLERGLVLLAGDLASMILAHGAIDWDALATAAIADASDVRTCAIAEYHAVMAAETPAPAAEAKLVSVNPPPVNALAAAVARIKQARGVSVIATPGGPV